METKSALPAESFPTSSRTTTAHRRRSGTSRRCGVAAQLIDPASRHGRREYRRDAEQRFTRDFAG
jgi:hypothetical protein